MASGVAGRPVSVIPALMVDREGWTATRGHSKQGREPHLIVLGVVAIHDRACELVVHPATDPGRRFATREQCGSGDAVELLSLDTPVCPALDACW
jgi:hypothetical protein